MKGIINRNRTIIMVVILVTLAVTFTAAVFAFDNFMNDTEEAATIESQPERNEYGFEPSDPIKEPESPVTDVEEEETEEEVNHEQINVEDLTTSVWIPSWDFNSGLASLRSKNQDFDSISPVWYSVNSDGTLVDRRNSRWKEIVNSKGNSTILPSIAISDPDILHGILSDETRRNTHINSVVQTVLINNFDGIDIDYEMIYLKDKDSFRLFIEAVRNQLNQSNKILSLTLLPQWGSDIIYTSFPETKAVQDYSWAGNAADEVRIMTYDFTSSGSKQAGPIAPITWMENVLIYATSVIPREKLVLGIHLYGYQWSDNFGVKATTYNDMAKIRAIPDYQEFHENTYEEGYATYTCPAGGNCTLYFQDIMGIEARRKLAAEYGIKGVVFWRLGGEGELL